MTASLITRRVWRCWCVANTLDSYLRRPRIEPLPRNLPSSLRVSVVLLIPSRLYTLRRHIVWDENRVVKEIKHLRQLKISLHSLFSVSRRNYVKIQFSQRHQHDKQMPNRELPGYQMFSVFGESCISSCNEISQMSSKQNSDFRLTN
jgi:hypothetical protein